MGIDIGMKPIHQNHIKQIPIPIKKINFKPIPIPIPIIKIIPIPIPIIGIGIGFIGIADARSNPNLHSVGHH